MNSLRDTSDGVRANELSTHVVTEETARLKFKALLEAQHALGSRRTKGRSLYQVVCHQNQWVGLILWTGAIWHIKARDQYLGWDAVTRSERLQLIVHQARFLRLEEARHPNLASAILTASLRDLPRHWEECFGYPPLLAETFTNPESHAGSCYKAAGWTPVGLSGCDGHHYADNFPKPLGAKKMWIKALNPQAKTLLCSSQLPPEYQAGLAAHAGERCALKVEQLDSLFEVFQSIPDPRGRSGRVFPIGAVLTLIALGLLRGCVHLSSMVRNAQRLSQTQRRHLRLPFKKGTRFVRAPGYSVFRDVLERIDVDVLAEALTRWMQSHDGDLPRTLAIDGKTIRDHLGLIVTLVDTEDGAPVAVRANLKGKGHELKTVQKLLASPEVSLHNAVVTGDSLQCQDQTAHVITREKGGDFVLQIRENQPTLCAYAQRQVADEPPLFVQPTAATDGRNPENSGP